MNECDRYVLAGRTDEASVPVLIGLLGNFRLLRTGTPVTVPSGGRIEATLSYLGLRCGQRITREQLALVLWPASAPALAYQSLNSAVYSLHRLLGAVLGGAAPVLHEGGYYRLNTEAGVVVDVREFDLLMHMGDEQARDGDITAAAVSYGRALGLYRGDLCIAQDVRAVVERERLRARYLSILSYLADYHYQMGEYATCMECAWRLLDCDPCHEDAHRLVMRCYVRRGQRSTALRHYHACVDILRTELDTEPESATTALFGQIRLHPEGV